MIADLLWRYCVFLIRASSLTGCKKTPFILTIMRGNCGKKTKQVLNIKEKEC